MGLCPLPRKNIFIYIIFMLCPSSEKNYVPKIIILHFIIIVIIFFVQFDPV